MVELRQRKGSAKKAADGEQLSENGMLEEVRRSTEGEDKPAPAPATEPPAVMQQGFWKKFAVWAGHFYVCLLIMLLQTMAFREIVSVRYSEYKSVDGAGRLPLFRTLQWGWYYVALVFVYGDFIKEFAYSHERGQDVLLHYARHHEALAFAGYCLVFMLSVSRPGPGDDARLDGAEGAAVGTAKAVAAAKWAWSPQGVPPRLRSMSSAAYADTSKLADTDRFSRTPSAAATPAARSRQDRRESSRPFSSLAVRDRAGRFSQPPDPRCDASSARFSQPPEPRWDASRLARNWSVVATRSRSSLGRPPSTGAAGDAGAGVVATRVPAWLRQMSKLRRQSQPLARLGRCVFFVLCSMLCFSLGLIGLISGVGLLACAGYNAYVIYKHPEYEAEMLHADVEQLGPGSATDLAATVYAPPGAARAHQQGDWLSGGAALAAQNPELAASAGAAAYSWAQQNPDQAASLASSASNAAYRPPGGI
ncbi:hypothetical protein AURANDRAFT_68765 [Aureococcus anophagefferens]|uniref:phosphatidate cytidylyltransferase n=1 Tax=Aureococcus anophagefferens TaxID=44056 RepID=F0YQP8_AURAN|nr:hypothetical protein AURANDRAFT_68765 [Aureococcus anophagefferens]EGB02561.1 hypothetical protein AURANDRAFT_68765 [Aureococcus anophagefferens]|eukprot:XP_009042740.1 hypothetical protein AURANDRAFT_68765 [Aureococcus anophagefferens]